jgi:hypothetical protein
MFVPVAARIIGRLIADEIIAPRESVVEMGNQTYSVNSQSINFVINLFQDREKLIKKYSVNLEKLARLSEKPAAKRPKDPGVPKVSEFFNSMGFSSYTSIDINDDFGSEIMDLNKDISQQYKYKKTYGLVTNIGVSEHLFNQEVFFKNAHNLTKSGGIMLHILPFLGYINHGFYNYQPRIFQDLAAANQYELLELYLADRDNIILNLMKQSEMTLYFWHNLEQLIDNQARSAFVIAVMKRTNNQEFIIPLQGKYIQDIKNDSIELEYSNRGLGSFYPPPKGFFELTDEQMKESNSARIRIKRYILKKLGRIIYFVLDRL